MKRMLILAAALLALPACAEPLQPEVQFAIDLRGPETVPSDLPSEAGVLCGLQLTASARGAGQARWTGTRFRWRDLGTGALLGSGEWDAEGTKGFWGAETIKAGEVRASKAGAVGGPVSFRVEVAFDFLPEGALRAHSIQHSFICNGR